MADNQTVQCIVNDRTVETGANPNMVVLDFLRNDERLTGTKEGCREGDCGACTVLIGELRNGAMEYRAVNSCLMPLGDVHGKHVITVEGINQPEGLNPVQKAFVDEGGTQCGFCTPGFLISFTGYCLNAPTLHEHEAVHAVEGNICRCTGHPPIKRALAGVVHELNLSGNSVQDLLQRTIDQKLLPEYVRSIPDRLKLLQEKTAPVENISEPTHIVSGGTDLYVQRAFTMKHEQTKRISHHKKHPVIREDQNHIFCSGLTSIDDFSRSAVIQSIVPNIPVFASLFGSTPIRNRATLAGNIVNASPIGDMTSLLLALDALLILRNGDTVREVPLRSFYKGYKQIDKQKNEIVETIRLTKPVRPRMVNFEKVSRRRYLDIASVNSAMIVAADGEILTEVHLTAGGVFATPLFLMNTSQFLTGKTLSASVIAEALTVMQNEIKPISDARGSSDYKRLLLRQLLFAHILSFFPEFSLPKEIF